MFTLDASLPSLDVDVVFASFDGWSAELAAFVVSAKVTIRTQIPQSVSVHPFVSRTVTARKFIDRTIAWPST